MLKDQVEKILYIRIKLVFPYYKEYVKKNGLNDLDANSIKSLLISKGNKSFIHNETQSTRKNAINKKPLGSCYMFKYEDIPDGNGIIINDVELNF